MQQHSGMEMFGSITVHFSEALHAQDSSKHNFCQGCSSLYKYLVWVSQPQKNHKKTPVRLNLTGVFLFSGQQKQPLNQTVIGRLVGLCRNLNKTGSLYSLRGPCR